MRSAPLHHNSATHFGGKKKQPNEIVRGLQCRGKKRDVRGEQESLPFLSCCGASVLHEEKKNVTLIGQRTAVESAEKTGTVFSGTCRYFLPSKQPLFCVVVRFEYFATPCHSFTSPMHRFTDVHYRRALRAFWKLDTPLVPERSFFWSNKRNTK